MAKSILPYRSALILSFVFFGGLVLFHVAIISSILFFEIDPSSYVWGGRAESPEALLRLEWPALVFSILFFIVILMRAKAKALNTRRMVKVLLWAMVVFFLLSALGNILAKSWFEKIFAVVALILAYLSFKLAMGPQPSKEENIDV